MRSRVLVVAWILAAALGLGPSLGRVAWAHGSLPISQQIMWKGDTMLVPAAYWGLFIGTDGGPWRWICEESINTNQSRQMALVSDGTLYATDRTGVTVSRDNGCTWGPVPSGISNLQILSLVADPVKPRAWALASSSDSASNGLFYSDDAGFTWKIGYAMPDHLPTGLRISDDGQTLLIGSVTGTLPRQPVLHASSDGGGKFTAQALTYQIDGQPLTFFSPLWIDPKVPGRSYHQVRLDSLNVLLRIDIGSGTPVEALRTMSILNAMGRNPTGEQVLVGTTMGVWVSKNDGAFTPLGTLGAAQCFTVHNGTFYACAWNYAPDKAAIARLSGDASSFTKVFQFNDTQSPVACPAGTPAANICPMVWANYADQLGVILTPGDGGTTPPEKPGGCSVSLASGRAPGAPGVMASLAILLALRIQARRRKSLSASGRVRV